ncbi:MAG: thioredoxin domain-containing protein [Flavobacteriales bacterium]|nr:thioredoxin domain-containing protein [Flavobacteriales bacterium]
MKKILFLLSITFLFSCGNTNSQIIEDVNSENFHQLIEKGDGIIIDVRTSQEFNSGHIIDATNIDFYSDDFTDKLKIVRKDVPIYVYCRSGGRSSSAANKMEKLGFTKVYNLLGGIGSWQSEGYETIKSKEVETTNQPKFTETQLNKILSNNKTVLIDFSTQWCVPCKKMKPIIEDIQIEKPNVKVLFIDADVNKELVKKYQVKGVPVFIVFKNGEEYFRKTGICNKQELTNQL